MTDRQRLLKKVQQCDFVLADISLYLDTHPEDQMALAHYKKHMGMKKDAEREYTMKYGPLRHSQYDGGARWNWVDGPWPWQTEEEAK